MMGYVLTADGHIIAQANDGAIAVTFYGDVATRDMGRLGCQGIRLPDTPGRPTHFVYPSRRFG